MNPIIFAGLKVFQQDKVKRIKSKLDRDFVKTSFNDLELVHLLKEICNFCKVDVADAKSIHRNREYVMARMYYAYFARHYTLRGLSKIGKEINRDHATIIHYVKTINNLIETDKETRQVVDSINKFLRTI